MAIKGTIIRGWFRVKRIVLSGPFLLFVVWVCYLVIGSLVFTTIEGPHQKLLRQQKADRLREVLDKMCLNRTLNSEALSKLLDQIMNHINPYEEFYKWNFAGGIHFCLTVVSTIGYGVLVPQTQLGRILCVLYAVIGIPINVLFLGRVGRMLTRAVDWLYNACCNIFRRPSCSSGQSGINRQGNGESRMAKPAKRSKSFCYHVDDSRTTDADRDGKTINGIRNIYTVNSHHDSSRVGQLSSSSYSSDALRQQEQGDRTSTNRLETVSNFTSTNAQGISLHEVNQFNRDAKLDRAEDEFVHNQQQERPKKAPLVFFALILFTTLVIFSVLTCSFGPMELTFIDAFYMQFVTFSTIGFGDLVPVHRRFNTSLESALSPLWSVYDMMYLLFGMSAVSVVISCATQADRIGKAMTWLCRGLSTQCHDHPSCRPSNDR